MALVEFLFLTLSLGSLASAISGHPWTTVVARRTTAKEAWKHPLFKETNVVLSLGWTVVFAATALILWISDSGVIVLGVALFNTGLGLISPWLGKTYAEWREPAYRERG